MGANFVQRGDSVDYIPSTDVAVGSVIVQGDLVGVSKLDIPAGTLGALHVTGVYDISKATGAGSAIPVGSEVYYDATNKVATLDADGGTNKTLGKSILDAGDDDPSVRVRLSQ